MTSGLDRGLIRRWRFGPRARIAAWSPSPCRLLAGPATKEAPTETLTDRESELILGTVSALGCSAPDGALDLLARYRQEILAWSRRLNLVSRADEARIVESHLVDSLRPLPHLPPEPGAWIADLGSGAGFPGIPLRIFRPDLRITLIESSEKRRVFLAHVCRKLGLTGAEAVATRAEFLAEEPRYEGRLDGVVARASGKLPDLMCWSAGLLRPGGVLLAYKPANSAGELEEAAEAGPEYGFHAPERLREPDLAWMRGILVVVRRFEGARAGAEGAR